MSSMTVPHGSVITATPALLSSGLVGMAPGELDALRFELLAERFEVLHFESDVIDDAPAVGTWVMD